MFVFPFYLLVNQTLSYHYGMAGLVMTKIRQQKQSKESLNHLFSLTFILFSFVYSLQSYLSLQSSCSIEPHLLLLLLLLNLPSCFGYGSIMHRHVLLKPQKTKKTKEPSFTTQQIQKEMKHQNGNLIKILFLITRQSIFPFLSFKIMDICTQSV